MTRPAFNSFIRPVVPFILFENVYVRTAGSAGRPSETGPGSRQLVLLQNIRPKSTSRICGWGWLQSSVVRAGDNQLGADAASPVMRAINQRPVSARVLPPICAA
jgi:hypothetical protein